MWAVFFVMIRLRSVLRSLERMQCLHTLNIWQTKHTIRGGLRLIASSLHTNAGLEGWKEGWKLKKHYCKDSSQQYCRKSEDLWLALRKWINQIDVLIQWISSQIEFFKIKLLYCSAMIIYSNYPRFLQSLFLFSWSKVYFLPEASMGNWTRPAERATRTLLFIRK